MSAPTSRDPLVVNTRDGVVWLRRAVTRDGHGLYAVTGSCSCPEFLMATLAELAAHGIAGSADALPMPVGSEPSERDRLRTAFIAALNEARHTHPCPATGSEFWTGCVHYDEAGHVSGVGSCHSERRADAVLAVRDAEAEFLLGKVDRLSARVAGLEAERHTTNEALDDAVQALRADRTEPDAPYVSRLLPPRDTVCARPECGHWGEDHHHGDTKCWAHLPRTRGAFGVMSPVTICSCSGFVAAPSVDESADRLTGFFAPVAALREDDPNGLRHTYLVGRDLPESGGAK